MASPVGQKFDAAVSVIKQLPKNGPFQPSYELMKRFYGLYKQATEGPCHQAKPAFWNVVQTQKWQAWSVLGDMKSDEAKTLYVEELLKIIEMMPQTEDVVTFLKVMGPFFELVTADEEQDDQVIESSPQVVKVNGHHVNGDVKMKDSKMDERGDQARPLQNGNPNDVSDHTNGQMEDTHVMNGGSTEESSNDDDDVKVNGHSSKEDEEREEEATRESRFVRVETAHQGENSAELSHPILISKSQLESAEDHVPSGSESESDGDEFCDSVDEPLISRISLAHVSKSDSLPSILEGQEDHRNQLTSTPFNGNHSVVTQAEVHHNVDAVIMPHYTTSSSLAPTTSTPSMRGGGEVTEGSKGQQGQDTSRDPSRQGHSSGYRTSDSFQNMRSVGGSQDSTDGGSGRGGGGGGGPGRTPMSPLPDGVVEQITISLERLQRDMNSVLVRLNTLETIAISRHQLETQQAYMREGGMPSPQDGSTPITSHHRPSSLSSWWPFSTLPVKTVFILLVWPFIVQWLLRFLARHRRGRTPPR